MAWPTEARRLENRIRIKSRGLNQLAECFPLEMWLISKRKYPVCEIRFPAGPVRGALNRAEHASVGRRVGDALDPLSDGNAIVGRADHGDLSCARVGPLLNEVTEHSGLSPGQQKLGLSHARRTARAKDHDGEMEMIYCQLGFSGRQASNSLTSAVS